MAIVKLSIPDGLPPIVSMKVKDSLVIKVEAASRWCFTDPSGLFPVSGHAGCLPPDGTYALQQILPPAIPGKPGDAYFTAIASSGCEGSPLTMHIIRVGAGEKGRKKH